MLSGSVSIATDLVFEFLSDSSGLSNVAILNKFNYQMSASGSDSFEYGSSDDDSDFKGFTAGDIRESERSVAASDAMTQQTSVAVGAVDSLANSDSIMQRLLL